MTETTAKDQSSSDFSLSDRIRNGLLLVPPRWREDLTGPLSRLSAELAKTVARLGEAVRKGLSLPSQQELSELAERIDALDAKLAQFSAERDRQLADVEKRLNRKLKSNGTRRKA